MRTRIGWLAIGLVGSVATVLPGDARADGGARRRVRAEVSRQVAGCTYRADVRGSVATTAPLRLSSPARHRPSVQVDASVDCADGTSVRRQQWVATSPMTEGAVELAIENVATVMRDDGPGGRACAFRPDFVYTAGRLEALDVRASCGAAPGTTAERYVAHPGAPLMARGGGPAAGRRQRQEATGPRAVPVSRVVTHTFADGCRYRAEMRGELLASESSAPWTQGQPRFAPDVRVSARVTCANGRAGVHSERVTSATLEPAALEEVLERAAVVVVPTAHGGCRFTPDVQASGSGVVFAPAVSYACASPAAREGARQGVGGGPRGGRGR